MRRGTEPWRRPDDWHATTVFFENRAALVLSGGGARAAYQVGVLQAIAEWLPPDAPVPVRACWSGRRPGRSTRRPSRARGRRCAEAVAVLDARLVGLPRRPGGPHRPLTRAAAPALHWALSLLSGGWLLLAAALAARHDAAARAAAAGRSRSSSIPASIAAGPVQALAVATTSYTTGHARRVLRGHARGRASGGASAAPACAARSTSTC
ncbi:MAG: hypothetical protein MZW92_03950 [Comamonadaceae bacterium]|nr:hypothetical protein [Comamonadaceae bacterium]